MATVFVQEIYSENPLFKEDKDHDCLVEHYMQQPLHVFLKKIHNAHFAYTAAAALITVFEINLFPMPYVASFSVIYSWECSPCYRHSL